MRIRKVCLWRSLCTFCEGYVLSLTVVAQCQYISLFSRIIPVVMLDNVIHVFVPLCEQSNKSCSWKIL